jgi:hypothetical protein
MSHKTVLLGVACCMFLCNFSLAPHFQNVTVNHFMIGDLGCKLKFTRGFFLCIVSAVKKNNLPYIKSRSVIKRRLEY